MEPDYSDVDGSVQEDVTRELMVWWVYRVRSVPPRTTYPDGVLITF
jgi:hypothetical protein